MNRIFTQSATYHSKETSSLFILVENLHVPFMEILKVNAGKGEIKWIRHKTMNEHKSSSHLNCFHESSIIAIAFMPPLKPSFNFHNVRSIATEASPQWNKFNKANCTTSKSSLASHLFLACLWCIYEAIDCLWCSCCREQFRFHNLLINMKRK